MKKTIFTAIIALAMSVFGLQAQSWNAGTNGYSLTPTTANLGIGATAASNMKLRLENNQVATSDLFGLYSNTTNSNTTLTSFTYGICSNVSSLNEGTVYGMTTSISGIGKLIGMYSSVNNSNQASSLDNLGILTMLSSQSKGVAYGHKIVVSNDYPSSTASTYGIHSLVNSASGTSTVYGVYSQVSGGNKRWAGYFTGGDMYVSGNVGIGTTNPQSKLEVNGNTKVSNGNIAVSNGEIRVSGSGNGGTGRSIIIQNDDKTQPGQAKEWKIWNMTEPYSNSLQFWAYDQTGCPNGLCANRLTLMDNGNVGIGTTDPKTKLQIGSILGLSVSASNLDPNQGYDLTFFKNTGRLLLGWNYYGGKGEQDFISNRANGNTGGFAFYDYGNDGTMTHIMTLTGAGNVGIGTKNPDEKLTVKGKIHAEEVILNANIPFPDYVFNSDYNLMPLKEVEQYVKTNNRLPEIPSAKEVIETGLSMGELQIKLLQKIEELTLYVIEQNKSIQDLKRDNMELKNEVTKLKNDK